MIPYESQLELAHAIQLERNPSVKYYRTQALKIPISHNQFLYPDFLIKYTNEEIAFHEVKHSKRFLDQKDIERYQRLKILLAQAVLLLTLSIVMICILTRKQKYCCITIGEVMQETGLVLKFNLLYLC